MHITSVNDANDNKLIKYSVELSRWHELVSVIIYRIKTILRCTYKNRLFLCSGAIFQIHCLHRITNFLGAYHELKAKITSLTILMHKKLTTMITGFLMN